jgi:hypothetical protein
MTRRLRVTTTLEGGPRRPRRPALPWAARQLLACLVLLDKLPDGRGRQRVVSAMVSGAEAIEELQRQLTLARGRLRGTATPRAQARLAAIAARLREGHTGRIAAHAEADLQWLLARLTLARTRARRPRR